MSIDKSFCAETGIQYWIIDIKVVAFGTFKDRQDSNWQNQYSETLLFYFYVVPLCSVIIDWSAPVSRLIFYGPVALELGCGSWWNKFHLKTIFLYCFIVCRLVWWAKIHNPFLYYNKRLTNNAIIWLSYNSK